MKQQTIKLYHTHHFSKGVAELQGKRHELTPIEFGIMHILADRQTHSRESIYAELGIGNTNRAIDVHICRIKAKLGDDTILCIWKQGYVISPQYRIALRA